MARFLIDFTLEGKGDLAWFPAHERKAILDGIRDHFTYEPGVETRNRKPIREEPVPRWELRLGRYRVIYEVAQGIVSIGAVGYKEHNVLFMRGREVDL